MKQIRHILIAATLTLGIFCSVLYTSCSKNKCGSTTCQNGGTCSSNVCVCPIGYSGNSCQTGWSDKFVGTYNCTRSNCSSAIVGAITWQSSITKSSINSGYTVDISDFNGANITVAATVDSVGNLSINPAAGVSGIHASTTTPYADGKISLTFTTFSAGSTYTCTMVMTKM